MNYFFIVIIVVGFLIGKEYFILGMEKQYLMFNIKKCIINIKFVYMFFVKEVLWVYSNI